MKTEIASLRMAEPNGPSPSLPSDRWKWAPTGRVQLEAPKADQPQLRPHPRHPSSDRPLASSRRFLAMGCLWLLAAVGFTAAGGLSWLPMPFPQVMLALCTVWLLGFFGKSTSFRAWVMGLDLRLVLLPHALRLVGAWFIVLHFRSQLPYAFAIPGGVGDLAAAITAMLVAFVPAQRAAGRWVWLAWNVFGLIDMLFVISTAVRLGLAAPDSMAALTRFPLGLLPLFVVPLILFSHVVLFLRLTGRGRG